MKAQDIYISPRQILSYLMDFEKKLPEPRKDFYTPGLGKTPITVHDLNDEAGRMMRFLGLNSYVPKCSFRDLGDGTGGNTNCCNPNPEVEINISSKYQNNLEAVLAVLAHEVCHKYLYVHGIYSTIEVVNETYTDLCTMYAGFGRLILNGYITEQKSYSMAGNSMHTIVNTSYLGYLNFPIYKRTLNIIRLVLWGENGKEVLEEEDDPLLQDAFRRWTGERDKKQLARDTLIDSEKEAAELTKNISLLQQLFSLVRQQQQPALEKAESQLYSEEWFTEGGEMRLKRRFSVFNSIYQSIAMDYEKEDNKLDCGSINRHTAHLITRISDMLGLKEEQPLVPAQFRCPFCGETYKSDKFHDKTALIKCPKCKHRIYVDCSRIDVEETRKDIERYNDELTESHRKAYMDSLGREKMGSYRRGLETGKKNEREQLQARIRKLPFWVRWILGSRLD